MEISTILGIVVAFGAYAASIFMGGGSVASLIDIGSIVMVFGGAIGATLIAYPLNSFLSLPTLFAQSFQAPKTQPQQAIELFVGLADQARREGLLSLEEQITNIENDFVKKGIMLIVDGVDPAVVRDIMEIDNDLASRRHSVGVALMEYMGSVAPAMGMLGTVTGLIGVLGNLNDMDALGPSMALAFITTLYGVILSNLFFNPMGNKLKQKDKTEMVAREVIVEGVLAIQAGENPRIVRDKLEAFLAPKLRGPGDDKGSE